MVFATVCGIIWERNIVVSSAPYYGIRSLSLSYFGKSAYLYLQAVEAAALARLLAITRYLEDALDSPRGEHTCYKV